MSGEYISSSDMFSTPNTADFNKIVKQLEKQINGLMIKNKMLDYTLLDLKASNNAMHDLLSTILPIVLDKLEITKQEFADTFQISTGRVVDDNFISRLYKDADE